MPASPLELDGRPLRLKKAVLAPDFEGRTVLTSDYWSYVELWLRRQKFKEAAFYWNQASEFSKAASGVSSVSAPLPLYYSFLNATKALLAAKDIYSGPYHGLSGRTETKRKAALSGEIVTIVKGGVAPAVSRLFADAEPRRSVSLKQLLYNIPYIHRCYTLTFPLKKELFIPIVGAEYVIKNGSTESWLQFRPDVHFGVNEILASLPADVEQDVGVKNAFVLRAKSRFKWHSNPGNRARNIAKIQNYNSRMRKNLSYIRGQPPTWYLKRQISSADVVNRSTILITLIAMHRLSELARYNPLKLERLLGTQANWLLTEFIRSAPIQFLDEVATEITGQTLAVPFVTGQR